MATPEKWQDKPAPDDALVITYEDGRVDYATRLGRPGLLLRLERTYPELDVQAGGDRTGLRIEHLFYLAWLALLKDHPEGDPDRPAADLLEWVDTVESIEDTADAEGPTPAAGELTSQAAPS